MVLVAVLQAALRFGRPVALPLFRLRAIVVLTAVAGMIALALRVRRNDTEVASRKLWRFLRSEDADRDDEQERLHQHNFARNTSCRFAPTVPPQFDVKAIPQPFGLAWTIG